MTRYRKPPAMVEADLYAEDDGPIRLSDVCAITKWHRDTILRAVERGELVGYQLMPGHRGSPWMFERRMVVRWLTAIRQRIAS